VSGGTPLVVSKRPTVYLAGPITGLSYDGAEDWRGYAKRRLANHGILGLSPLRGKEYLRTSGPLSAEDYHDKPLSSPRGITTRDRWDCTRSDVVLVNLIGAPRVSIGTMIELGWADAARNPIVLAMEPAGNVHDHAMVTEVAGFRADSVEGALELVIAILGER